VSAGSLWASLTGAVRTLEQVSMNPLAPPLRLAEAAGVLSLATDLAMGQPLEHGLRTAMLALRLAQAMGLSEDDQVTVFYTGLLHFAGCTAESEIDARFFGDEMAARPRMLTVAHGSRPACSAPGWACPGRFSWRCGTCTNGGTATACRVSCTARRSRWRYG
jgi:hypothetical protein